jgi:hypothetical protein
MTEQTQQTQPTNEFDTLASSLKKVLEVNGFRQGTKTARTCEYSFLQGAVVAKPELLKTCPAIYICMMSGRSILSLLDK